MAGYSGYSKSNNAITAEADGKLPLTHAAKTLKVPAAFIREAYSPCEWHHSSKFYRVVAYYDADAIRSDEGMPAKLAAWRAKKTKRKSTDLGLCTVTYLDWGGTRCHPRATEVTIPGCRVTDTGGSFVTIVTPDGRRLRKGKATRGFNYFAEAARISEAGVDQLGTL